MLRLILPCIGLIGMVASVGIVAGSVQLADEIADPAPVPLIDPPPGLPATWRSVDRAVWSDSGEIEFESRPPLSLDAEIRSAAKHFGIPHVMLRGIVLEALGPGSTPGHPRLTALSPEALGDIGLSGPRKDDRLIADLVEFLGRDMRPFDSRLSQDPEIGTALHAAHLVSRRAATVRTLGDAAYRPSEETIWFLAMLAHERCDREVNACVAEAVRLGPKRIGHAFTELGATAALLTDETFLLRSFLQKWKKGEAMERREDFRHAAARLHAALKNPHAVID